MSKIIGIDLGTTHSVAAAIQDGRPRVIPNAEGDHLTPSVFAVTHHGNRLVGAVAKGQASANPDGTILSVKRHMGTDRRFSIGERVYSPQEISAFILRKIKADAETYLGEPVTRAVITVPAYFNDTQRQATHAAGVLAGFDVMRIISEPTAAALAYGLNLEDIQTVMVWDLGGGTFDVSILDLGDGFFHVKAVAGSTSLGGNDWDQRLANYFAESLQRDCRMDVRSNPRLMQMLMEISENAKRTLSTVSHVRVFFPFTADGGRESWIDRETFERITADLSDQLLPPTRQALADSGLTAHDIDRVILVGGGTRMPAVRHLAENIFKKQPYVNIDPDEVVAIGAAVQAGMLTGELKNVALADVTPLSLGVEIQGGIFTRIIPRNATIPISESQIFTNAADNQTCMDIHVLQGEREMAADNFSLGRFQLSGISALPRGTAQVEVSFEIDVNGMVTVSADDLHTGSQAGIKIRAGYLMTDSEVEQALREAEMCKASDVRRKEEIRIEIWGNNMIEAARLFQETKAGTLEISHIREIERARYELKASLTRGSAPMIQEKALALKEMLEI